MTVTLIGIDHDDLHGYDRLLTLLKRSTPDMIVSENDVKTHKRTLRQRQYIHNNLASMARVITEQAPIDVNEKTAKSLLDTYGFEAAAIRDYATTNGVGVEYVGDTSHGMRGSFEDDLERRLYQRFFTAPNDELITQSPTSFQAVIDDAYGDPDVPESVIDDLSLRDRDVRYAEELEPYVGSSHEHVTGVFGHNHVYGSYEESVGEQLSRATVRHLGHA